MSADAPSLFWAVNPHLTRRHFRARLSLAGSGERSRAGSSASTRQGLTTPATDIEVAWGMRSPPTGTSWRRRPSSVRDSTAGIGGQEKGKSWFGFGVWAGARRVGKWMVTLWWRGED